MSQLRVRKNPPAKALNTGFNPKLASPKKNYLLQYEDRNACKPKKFCRPPSPKKTCHPRYEEWNTCRPCKPLSPKKDCHPRYEDWNACKPKKPCKPPSPKKDCPPQYEDKNICIAISDWHSFPKPCQRPCKLSPYCCKKRSQHDSDCMGIHKKECQIVKVCAQVKDTCKDTCR